MKKWNKSVVAGLCLAGLSVAGMGLHLTAAAQEPSPARDGTAFNDCGNYGRGGGYGWHHRGDGAGPDAKHWGERMAARETAFRERLKLTPPQEAAWKEYTSALKASYDSAPRWDRADWDKLTTPERMEKMQSLRKEREKRMDAHYSALKKFYNQLTPEQQKIFDAETSRSHRYGHRGRGGRY